MLVYSESGIGDTIQFARFLPWLAARGAKVVVECHPPLVDVLELTDGISQVVARGMDCGHHDFSCPTDSLPGFLGATIANLPTSPYIRVRRNLIDEWGVSVRAIPGYRIGVCWRCNPRPVHKRGRSYSPSYLKLIADIPNVKLVNLQYGEEPPSDVPLVTLNGLNPRSMRLVDVAAVMQHLDLVITCDTSIAHLAGAMGVPVWVALTHPADWRWMLDREDSPWYPSMRLFRQNPPGDWRLSFERMAHELKTQLRS